MARVDLLSAATAPITTRQFFEGGDAGPIVGALAQVPELVAPVLAFISAALGGGATTMRHKEFAIVRTSALLGCRYCILAHTVVALDVGLTADEIRGLRGEVDIDEAFPSLSERRLIRWIDAMAASSGPVPDDTWRDARSSFADHLLIELSTTIGATMFLNRFATGFELPTSDDTLARLAGEGLL
ncbi:MAG: carboxymuconolactone decarboxylase family protein [Acidimicrobiales bacterium]